MDSTQMFPPISRARPDHPFEMLDRTAMMNSPHTGENFSILDVLVVDDETLIRWSLRQGLSRRGHRVTEAGDGAQALEALSIDAGRFDVVILDFRLPDCQDLTLLAEVRQRAPRAAVWMMTAFGDTSMRAGALALGARAVIDKPFQVNSFIARIESGSASDSHPNV
jgi:DNA-binding NtrC family response regulator